MADNRRNKKHNQSKERDRDRETKRVILAKKEDKDRDSKVQDKCPISTTKPKILLKPKEKETQPTPTQINIITREIEQSSQEAKITSVTVSSTNCKEISKDEAPIAIAQPPVVVPVMAKPHDLITARNQLNTKVFEYIMETNCHFKVIGVIGMQGVGKSTILNLLEPVERTINLEKHFFQQKEGIFSTETVNIPIPNSEGIKMFITKDRTILLDCCPILNNIYKKDCILSEIDDIKMIIILLSICHVLLVVQDDFFNINLMRLIQCAEMMKSNLDKNSDFNYSPNIIFIKNHAIYEDFENEKKILLIRMYEQIFKYSKLRIYPGNLTDFAPNDKTKKKGIQQSVNLFQLPHISSTKQQIYTCHPDLKNLVTDFRLKVFMSPRNPMVNTSTPFTEKYWAQLVTSVWESNKNNYFLRKYETLRTKLNPHNTNESGSSSTKDRLIMNYE